MFFKVSRSIIVAASVLMTLLMPIKSYAMTEVEAENSALEYVLKLQGINTHYHKNLWLEMKRLRKERSDPGYKGEKNLIKDLIQRYNLDPIKKSDDQCQLMERMVGYIIGSQYFGGLSQCIEGPVCAKYYSILPQEEFNSLLKYGEGDGEGSYQDAYVLMDSYLRPIGIWSSFNKSFSIKRGFYKIGQGYREEGYNHLNYLIPQKKSNSEEGISYLKIDKCYIRELRLKLDTVYIQKYYLIK